MAKLPDGRIFIYKCKLTKIVIEDRELIMCKSCMHFRADGIPENGFGYCEIHSETHSDDDYCSEAEKKG